ncbi:hypothetical protein PsorP6_001979 [Peronosclerospora sorghi]|uniref:Uncharacterized protein n=1 Tax=Peronosclerospora sorghi TaxID=230839 RepID=A0ACC0WU64_9STRA|nr:hypothetical protein PsorP6_001979 [Peronosclerospora sorghi]
MMLAYMRITPGCDMDLHIAIMEKKITELEDLYNKLHEFQIMKYMMDSIPDYGKFLNIKNLMTWAREGTLLKPEDVKKRMRSAAAIKDLSWI